MSANLNSIYSSFINNTSYTDQSSIERTINAKDISSDLFATQLKNQKITDTYINEMKLRRYPSHYKPYNKCKC